MQVPQCVAYTRYYHSRIDVRILRIFSNKNIVKEKRLHANQK